MAADLSVAYMVDRFGRKKMHVIGGLLLSSLGCGVAFVPSYTFFVIARSILSWASMVGLSETMCTENHHTHYPTYLY